MSLRDEAIKAIITAMDAAEAESLGCDCESCRRGAGAALDGLLDWLRTQNEMSTDDLVELLSEEEQ